MNSVLHNATRRTRQQGASFQESPKSYALHTQAALALRWPGVPPGSWFGIIREEDHLEETPQLTRDEARGGGERRERRLS